MLNIQSITSFYTANALNAQTDLNAYKNVDGKIFVSTDMFTQEKGNNLFISALTKRLNNIDNLAKDRNGSQSSPFARTNSKAKRQEPSIDDDIFSMSEGRLLNLYA